MSGKRGSSNKKIIIYAVIGMLAVAAVSITFLGKPSQPSPNSLADQSKNESIAQFKAALCGPDSKANTNTFITEHVLKQECEIPYGITVDKDSVWYVSTKQGTLAKYNLATGNMEEFAIPSWPARSNPVETSFVYAIKPDSAGHIWFTDSAQNLLWRFSEDGGTFDMFKSPAASPVSFDFDRQGNIYLVGALSNSTFFGQIGKMKTGTRDGFTEIKLPLEPFTSAGIPRAYTGSIVVDRDRNVAWITALAFQVKGEIYRYDISKNKMMTFGLPSELTSPSASVLDEQGNLWVTDHDTSMFFSLNPSDGKITKYVTSLPSSRIFGGSVPDNAISLPFYLQRDGGGNIWFNEHAGNRIAKFDPRTKTLTEYWVPTQNKIMGKENCPPNAETCGIANAIQLAVGPQGEVWFSEWSENKIGRVNAGTQVPFSVSAPEEVTVNKGGNAEVKVTISAQQAFKGDMVASGTFTPSGHLGNSTGIFSQQSITVDGGGSKQVSFVFTPADDLPKGQYVLMVGAEDADVSVLRAVTVNVV